MERTAIIRRYALNVLERSPGEKHPLAFWQFPPMDMRAYMSACLSLRLICLEVTNGSDNDCDYGTV